MPDRTKIIQGRHFGRESVPADGKRFVGCTFDGTVLVFRGKAQFDIEGPGNFSVEFAGAAKLVLDQLLHMHHFGMHDLVDQIFATIKNPTGAGVQ